jgi:hypothetical protein
MANFINIKDFDGVLTNADIEDLPDNVAQEIKNLKIQAGKLEKTFGAGTPSGVPSIGLSFVDSGNYIVYNVFTFVSDKFSGDTNDAGDGYRYLLVTVHTSTQAVKLFWWDSGLPDVDDHLQIEDNIVLFTTESPHGITEDDYILVQDCKDNASPQADISGAGVYDQADHIPNTVTVGVNTDNARQWGGSFFNTAVATGVQNLGWGGKVSTHLTVDDTVTYDSPPVVQSTIEMIAIASMYGQALCLASVPTTGTQGIVIHDGTSTADLNTSAYNGFRALSEFKVCSMLGFNNAVYVHYSYDKDGTNYNPLVKYTLSSEGAVGEAVVSANLSTTATTATSFMHICNGVLYVLVQKNGLFSVNTSDSIATVTVTSADIDEFAGLASITETNLLTSSGATSLTDVTHAYLFVATINSPDFDLFYNDVRDASVTTWGRSSTFTGTLLGMTSTDFGENSDRSESIIIHYTDSGGTRLHYSTHNDTTVYNTFTDVDSSTFPTTIDIEFISSTYNAPIDKYLIVGTDNVASPLANGSLYRVSAPGSVSLLNGPLPGTKAFWNPTCFADCVTETHSEKVFFEHAKGYIGVYGTNSQTGSTPDDSADIVRMTDIGWLNNTFNTSGDCEYRWIDITSRYDIDTLYHKKDRNPIIPFGDTLRVLPGNIAKVGSTEAKGAWLGWIDRSLFNGGKVHGPAFFGKANRLTNPFTFKNTELSATDEEIRTSDTIKYTVTAVYDGVQETPIEDETIRQIVSGSDDISKSEIKLILDLPISTMSERITGLNVYRAEKVAGVYETYKLIISYSFVDTGDDSLSVTTSSDTNLITNLEAFNDKTLFVKDQDDAIQGWLDTMSPSSSFFSSSADGGDAYDWTSPSTEYAIKVGSFEKQKIETLDAITGYAETGCTLNEDLDATETAITVNGVGSVVDGTIYKLGYRDLDIGTSLGDEDDDAVDYERIKVSSRVGDVLTVIRGWDGSAGDATLAKEHSTYAPIKADALSTTGWFKIVTDDNMEGRFHDESWKMYSEKVGPGWNTLISTKSSGAFAGKYMGVIIPQPSEDTAGDYTMAPWRDTDGTMKISSIVGKKFTATGGIGDSDNPVYASTFKVEKAYTTWDEQLGFTLIETDKAFQASNWTDPEVLISTFADVSAVVSSDLNEIAVIDKGLSSLGEHPYAQEDKIKINAQYAKILKGRLFLGNIVLDPGNENEVQNDWVAYSELNGYDVRPVSNVIPFPDREGGQITGLSELFGRLIIFKAQAIFVLDVVNPSDPTTWVRKESKINIGNIAPEGIVEVHDSIFFVHHDGIYRLDANTVASSDATPSIMEKITLVIEDQFLLANDKSAVKGVYDQKNNEILYTWDASSPATQVVWAYHITLKTWRKVDTTTNLDILTFGENSGPVAWDNTDTDIKKFDVNEAVGTAWKSKRFPLDLDRKRLIRYGMVKFTGTDTLTVNIYLDGAGSASFTKTITADGGINRFPIKRYGKNFEIELTTPSSLNAFSVEQMRIETE